MSYNFCGYKQNVFQYTKLKYYEYFNITRKILYEKILRTGHVLSFVGLLFFNCGFVR